MCWAPGFKLYVEMVSSFPGKRGGGILGRKSVTRFCSSFFWFNLGASALESWVPDDQRLWGNERKRYLKGKRRLKRTDDAGDVETLLVENARIWLGQLKAEEVVLLLGS